MADSRFVEWGFLLVTASNVLLIALVLSLLWQRLFPRAAPVVIAEAGEANEASTSDAPAQVAAGLIESAQRQNVVPLGQTMTDSLDLVGRLDEVDGAAYPDWKRTNQPQIDDLLSNREEFEFKLDDLKAKLDRAHKLVTNLHSQNREMRGAEANLRRMTQRHDRLQDQLIETRQERDGLKATVERLGIELAQLRRQHNVPVEVAASEVDEEVKHELETLRESLEEERAKLSRTLVEKQFIEQVYIDTDAVTDDYQALQREHAALREQLQLLQARLETSQSA
ncbi:hypothetical protein SB14R_08805 [Pseudomonas oryzihabitans]|nr:hypothetical protein SB14R_08805 [Pseudomonas psychrotolerans]